MLVELREKVRERRRQREVAGGRRAGRYARSVAWDRQWAFARRFWLVLIALLIGPSVVSVPLAFWQGGAVGWAMVGGSVATGFWMVVVVTVVVSGATAQLMGVTAEEWTVGELRPIVRRGWRLVNGLKLRGDFDIDHVVVGPPGVLVVETKWSAEPWPIGAHGSSFMADALARAVGQAHRNRRDVADHFSRQLAGAPVVAAVVLWSASDTSAGGEWVVEEDGITVVRGQGFRRWIATLDGQVLDPQGVQRVWAALDEQAGTRDARDVERLGPPRPTLGHVFWRWLVQPFLGVLAALYGVGLVFLIPDWRVTMIGCLAALVGGLAALRLPPLRRVALGWIAVTTLLIGAAAVVTAIMAIR